jgi:hypothetical protein
MDTYTVLRQSLRKALATMLSVNISVVMQEVVTFADVNSSEVEFHITMLQSTMTPGEIVVASNNTDTLANFTFHFVSEVTNKNSSLAYYLNITDNTISVSFEGAFPMSDPTQNPTFAPTENPTIRPTPAPSTIPTFTPSVTPSTPPTLSHWRFPP